MTAKAWTVIVPYSRPAQSRHVTDSILAQRLRPRRVIICGNGAGILGLDLKDAERLSLAGIETVMLQLPEANVCHARNAGIEYALHLHREGTGTDFLTYFDDDDHYLPGWLELVDAHAAENRIVGCRQHTIVDDRGVFRVHYEPAEGPADWLSGGTLAFGVDVALRLRFPIMPYGEDCMFCLLAKGLGIEVEDVGPGEYLYDRRGAATSHAWPRDVRQHMSWQNKISELPGDLDAHKHPPGHGAPIATQ
jgi:glycosyltransferase involved in cell wall biosynthesis